MYSVLSAGIVRTCRQRGRPSLRLVTVIPSSSTARENSDTSCLSPPISWSQYKGINIQYKVRHECRLFRLTKYQLLLKDLLTSCHPSLPGRFELQDSLGKESIKLFLISLFKYINIKYFVIEPFHFCRVRAESDQVSERLPTSGQHSWSPSHPPPSRISHLSGKSRY